MIPRTFTAYQVLAAGAKTLRELVPSLGCTQRQAERAIDSLIQSRQVRRVSRPGAKRFVYEVAR